MSATDAKCDVETTSKSNDMDSNTTATADDPTGVNNKAKATDSSQTVTKEDTIAVNGVQDSRIDAGLDQRSDALAAIESEFKKHADRISWHLYYQEIREKCSNEAKENELTTLDSQRSQNRSLNRYRDVNPYDHSRIVLKRCYIDYINANLVKLEKANRKYILTQGPLPETVGHFWLMVWEQNSCAILMLNKLIEKRQVKCHLYYPEKAGAENALELIDVNLMVEFIRGEEYKNYVRRWFKLTDLETKKSREIMQFHYTNWPDFGIPSSPNAFLQFLQCVRSSGALNAEVGPAVVHCSAGIGRSGTFCLVDCCLVLVDKHKTCDVANVLCELRKYRMGLIQTADQLYFSYQAIIEGIKLLNDPTFLDYQEEPIAANNKDEQENTQTHEHISLDETPPPLPPRTHSLATEQAQLQQQPQNRRTLPTIPNNENNENNINNVFKQNVADSDRFIMSKDALNNFINNEMLVTEAEAADNIMMNRKPLPPVPWNHMATDSDDEISDYDIDEEDNDDDDDDDDDIGYTFENDNTNVRSRDKHDDKANENTNDVDDVNANNEQSGNTILANANTSTNTILGQKELSKANGVDDNNASNSIVDIIKSELKRRKQNEQQSKIEQKVNDIKRKIREIEDNKVAAKKRRSLLTYIAAGVVVGVVCVYAYTKLG